MLKMKLNLKADYNQAGMIITIVSVSLAFIIFALGSYLEVPQVLLF